MYDIDNALPGDILHGANNRNRNTGTHFIIYLDKIEGNINEFYGAMLTTSPGYGNIALEPGHFKDYDEKGNPYKATYNRSFISRDKYIKKANWAPFTKVGELSEEGLLFVKKAVGANNPTHYPDNA